jgi:hypothetical protein
MGSPRRMLVLLHTNSHNVTVLSEQLDVLIMHFPISVQVRPIEICDFCRMRPWKAMEPVEEDSVYNDTGEQSSIIERSDDACASEAA